MTRLTLYQDVTGYLREGYNQARAERNLALGFVMVTYQKMLASSSYAVRQSFRRRIAKLRVAAEGRGCLRGQASEREPSRRAPRC